MSCTNQFQRHYPIASTNAIARSVISAQLPLLLVPRWLEHLSLPTQTDWNGLNASRREKDAAMQPIQIMIVLFWEINLQPEALFAGRRREAWSLDSPGGEAKNTVRVVGDLAGVEKKQDVMGWTGDLQTDLVYVEGDGYWILSRLPLA